jgi:hypothetical protein
MGPRRGAGKTKRPASRGETGAHPGDGHGGSAGLAKMAGAGARMRRLGALNR